MSATVSSDRPPQVSGPSPATPEPEGRLVRSKARPGLTPAGVALLSVAVGLVASVIAELVTDGLGWMFAVPFVAVSAYCAAEVSASHLRSAVVTPPLVALLVAAVNPVFASNVAGIRGWTVKTLTTLTTMAPTLLVATASAALIVGVRYWRSRRAG